MRFAAMFSIVALVASFHTTFASTPTMEELIELSGVATGPSEYNEEGYRALAALKEAANIPTPTAPEARSEDGITERMTNAERLANGLPLKAPTHRRSRTPLNRIGARGAQPSPGPLQTISGRLAVYDGSGQKAGYAKSSLLSNTYLVITQDVTQALRVSVSFDSLQPSPSQLQVTMMNSNTPNYPLLTLIQGRDNTNQDISLGSYHYLYTGGGALPGSGAGSTGMVGQNTYTATTARVAQTDVWALDRISLQLTPTWINSDGNGKTFSFYTQSTAFYGLIDSGKFAARYPSQLGGPYTYRIEPVVETPL